MELSEQSVVGYLAGRHLITAEDRPTVEALDLLLSFETWSRLRDDQGLNPAETREVLETAIRKLTT